MMKRMLSVFCLLLAFVLMFGGTVCAAEETDLIDNTHFELPIRNAVANAQYTPSAEAMNVLSEDEEIGILLTDVSGLDDIAAFLSACMEKDTVPMLKVATVDEVNAVEKAVTAVSCKDLSVISDDPEVLRRMRLKKTTIRNGLIVELESDSLTSKEADAIRKTVRSAPATFCVIESEFASRALVEELQQLALAVWVNVPAQADEDNDVQTIRAFTSGANGIITESASAAAALANEVFEEYTMTRTPLLIGHRGNPSQAPENSLSGFVTAYENGADIVEIDVDITKDGEIVIMHDNTLNRTTDYDGNLTVNEMTLSQIKNYHLLGNDGKVSEETVPTLKELLEEFRDKDCRIFVELKGNHKNSVSAVTALITEYDMEDRVDFISFNANFLTEVQDSIEGMSTGYLCSPGGAALSSKIALKTLYPSILSTHGTKSTINPNKSVASSYYFQAATDRGLTVWPWTYAAGTNGPAFLLSPNGLTTDDVQWAKDMSKYVEADVSQVTAFVGSAGDVSVTSVSYGGESRTVAAEDRIVKVIDGEDCLSVENGELVGTGHGKATVVFGYRTETTNGAEYVLYTQPVTVNVIHLAWIIGIAVAVCVVIGTAIVWIVRSIKKKNAVAPIE